MHFKKRFSIIFTSAMLFSQISFASTPEEAVAALKQQGYSEKQIDHMIVMALKKGGAKSSDILDAIQKSKTQKGLENQKKITDLKAKGLNSDQIVDELFDLHGRDKFYVSSAQGFFNSVGGFVGNTAKISGKVAVASLYVAGAAAKSYSETNSNQKYSGYQPMYTDNEFAAHNPCDCKGYDGPGGPCYAGPGGPAYNGPGGPAYDGPGGPCYAGPGGPEYSGPGGPAYDGPGGPRYAGPGGPAYNGPGGPAYDGPGGPCYAGPGGPCYSGPGGTGENCPDVC